MRNSSGETIALVTGTSSGIGLHTAVQLARSGFTVIATMRDTSKAGPLQACAKESRVSLDVRQLDVTDEISIADCIEGVLQKYDHIDLLVNNAGTGYLATLEQTPVQDLRQVMEVNFFGVWRVTQAVFASMRERGRGRIITVTSVGGLIGQPFNDAYCAAKFATEGLMESLNPVAKRLGISLSLVEPGPVNTEFVVNAHQLEREKVQPAYREMRDDFVKDGQRAYRTFGQSGEQVARVIARVATRRSPAFRYTTSGLVNLMARVLLAGKIWQIR
jgi:NAD(P)-dependent dehydrogenase (short-subunit alcohol dehydrogenase family)